MRVAVAELDAWYVNYVATLPSARLGESLSFRFTDGQNGTMTREEMLAHVVTHGGHHRGAVGRIMAQGDTQAGGYPMASARTGRKAMDSRLRGNDGEGA